MTFAQVPPNTAVFLDANTLIYHFSKEPTYGPACTQLLKRVEQATSPASRRRTHWRTWPTA